MGVEHFDVLVAYKADNGNYIFHPLPVVTIIQWDRMKWKFAGHIQSSRDDHALMSGLYLLPNECERIDFSTREFALRKQMQDTHVGFGHPLDSAVGGGALESLMTRMRIVYCTAAVPAWSRATGSKRGGHV